MTYTAAIVAVSRSGSIIQDPSTADIKTAASLHVLAISSKGQLLLNESEGEFDLEIWEAVVDRAQAICQGSHDVTTDGEDTSMVEGGETQRPNLEASMREVIADRIEHDHAWKIAAT